jgi:hypothetical protein
VQRVITSASFARIADLTAVRAFIAAAERELKWFKGTFGFEGRSAVSGDIVQSLHRKLPENVDDVKSVILPRAS